LVPASFQGFEEFGFDLRGDVAVDLGQSVGQVVSKALGFSDFGNVVGDQPCLVAVSEAVEGEARPHRVDAFTGVAIDSGAEHASVEGAAAQSAPEAAGEHERAGASGEVVAEKVDEERWQAECGPRPGAWVVLARGRVWIRAGRRIPGRW
jgi:hypothetical protein